MSFPELQSIRLKLRSLEDKDLTALYALRSNEQVNRYLDRPPARSVEDAQAFISNPGWYRRKSIVLLGHYPKRSARADRRYLYPEFICRQKDCRTGL